MPRGGVRKGAGRPKGQGKYGEQTKAVRIPISKVKYISEVINKVYMKCRFIAIRLLQGSHPLQTTI